MIPLTITADLGGPVQTEDPLLFDGLLLGGLGAWMGWRAGDWLDPSDIYGAELPLARTPGGWYAASSAVVGGTASMAHRHRRAPIELYERRSGAKSISMVSGPDKSLRIPQVIRSGVSSLTWTCVGDEGRVVELLHHVPAVGRVTAHGWGWVRAWHVHPGGPGVDAYAADVALRHLPVDAAPALTGRCRRRDMPLTPPYHDRGRAVPCWQRVGA